MITRKDVQAFLEHIKGKMIVFDITYRPRGKNLVCLINLELNPYDRDKYIRALTYENYIAGPNNTDGNLPQHYEFCMIVKGVVVYIKLNPGPDRKPVDCMSFHESTNANPKYPLK
jgi:hypothetical protein